MFSLVCPGLISPCIISSTCPVDRLSVGVENDSRTDMFVIYFRDCRGVRFRVVGTETKKKTFTRPAVSSGEQRAQRKHGGSPEGRGSKDSVVAVRLSSSVRGGGGRARRQ